MPDFVYIARELSGREIQGTLSANSEQEVISTLAGKSLFPTRISLQGSATPTTGASGKRISGRKLAVMYGQLADLLHSGVPLMRSLQVLEEQSSIPAIRAVLADVRQQVTEGSRLADAMRRHPKAFNELAVSMVRAGEEGGFLEDVLKRVAQFTEHTEDMKSKVTGAMAYPGFLMLMCLGVVTWMLVYLVPKFEPIFARLREQGRLPTPTVILLSASGFVQSYGLLILAVCVAAGFALRNFLKSEQGRFKVDGWRLKVKGFGPVIRNLAISRFCRMLGTLLKNGVPILQSLRIAKDATGNLVLGQAISNAADNVSAGKSLARPLAASGHFPREVVEMIAVGEEANNLEQVLINVADNMEQRTFRDLDLAVRMLEPLMLLVMGIVITFMMLALLLPVFQGSDALG
ncbi:MAG: type II secretion system F family protein [Planctomycetaceae bacterium]|nr:MAG: type II secretion system F family protein [Planctomycetaceae bacterium]